jgi:hypothetical protein
MVDQLPLPALLSQALVAFTIELDNEFEHQMPHRTRNHGATGVRGGPALYEYCSAGWTCPENSCW